ncbi:restriction endonuclease subunit S [Mammaliicoccus sp. E-M26]|uniref:restriction endonuclease subunit S n=1 Tax=Mammaliicoccus sp. E-M26 TaxID=2898686 RepID=UPI001EFA37C0|nr:restriction endonuclease subunit S [Mammaliicoccus sp. E-M26]
MTNELKNVPELRFSEFDGVWENSKLGTVANVYDGTHQTPKYTIEGIKFLSVENIKTLNSNKFISKEAFEKEFKIRPEFGDVLMTRIGDVGTPNVIETNEDLAYYVSLALLKPKKLNSYFLESLIRSQTVQNELWRKTLHIAFPKKINKNEIAKVEINYPEQMEQQKIGEFFSKLDRQIELEEQKLAKLEEQKKGYMQKIFSQELRFKDENGNEYPEWEEKTIKDVYKVTRGYVLARKLMSDNPNSINKYPVYSSQTSNNGLMGYYSDYLYQDAITWTTDGANAGSVSFRQGKFYCTNVCGVLLNELGNSNVCMAEMLNNIAFKYVSKVGNPKLMNNVMAMIKLKFPCLEEQQAISKFLNVFSEVIDNQNKKVELLKERKKGFLQKMFV